MKNVKNIVELEKEYQEIFKIAVYWDFENIHLAAKKSLDESTKKAKTFQEPKVVDINILMTYINSLGEISINRAYNDWQKYVKYKNDLMTHSVDLIQLFSYSGNGKNGADIRMSLDILEDLTIHPHITHVIVMAGDSDYISVAQKIRQKGKYIIGIGVDGSINKYFKQACTEFNYYKTILAKYNISKSADLLKELKNENDVNSTKVLLLGSILSRMKAKNTDYAYLSDLKNQMKRSETSFDEANYGYESFTKYLTYFQEFIVIRDQRVYLKENYIPNRLGK